MWHKILTTIINKDFLVRLVSVIRIQKLCFGGNLGFSQMKEFLKFSLYESPWPNDLTYSSFVDVGYSF